MLHIVVVVIFVLWILGLATANTFGGLIHLLLIVAVAFVVLRIIGGRKSLGS